MGTFYIDLVNERKSIQQHLTSRGSIGKREERRANVFAKKMMRGDVKSALRLLSSEQDSGVLGLKDLCGEERTVKDVLLSKHPSKIPADPSMIVDNNPHQDSFHPVIFDKITGALIRKAATRTSGAAGPSSADARHWRRYCCSFQRSSDDLCDSLASVARKLCTTL